MSNDISEYNSPKTPSFKLKHVARAPDYRGTEFCNPLVILKIPSRDSNVSILDQSIKAGTKHEKVIIGLELT
ncbi:hypothetical protein, partial [Cytobacillus gottheilii]